LLLPPIKSRLRFAVYEKEEDNVFYLNPYT